jgi:hypothetical protein
VIVSFEKLIENHKISPHFGSTFSYYGETILTKNGSGIILGEFFTNTSRHPNHFLKYILVVTFLQQTLRYKNYKHKFLYTTNSGGDSNP